MSDVIVSKCGKKIFHELFCPYAKRINIKNKSQIPDWLAVKRGYCECKFCRSVRGIVYKYRAISDYEISYDPIDDAMCVKTPVGFWKLIWRENIQQWQLFHMNRIGWRCFNKDFPSSKLMRGAFHRQEDFIPSSSVNKAMRYIHSHDNCYQQAEEHGIKSMPQNTPKQRLHYRQQRNRKRKESIKNVYRIFNEIERKEKNEQKK